MHLIMYAITACLLLFIPSTILNQQYGTTVFASVVAALAFWMGRRYQNNRFAQEVKSIKSEKLKTEKIRKFVRQAKGAENKLQQNNTSDDEFAGKVAGAVLVILELQLSLLSHIEDVKKHHFTIGYMFGLVDGFMQARNIDIDDGISLDTMKLVLDGQLSEEETRQVLDIYENHKEEDGSLLMRGLLVGGEDVYKQLGQNEPPMGLVSYFDDDCGDADTPDLNLERWLEKLTALYKDGLISKKVYEKKQAEILEEI